MKIIKHIRWSRGEQKTVQNIDEMAEIEWCKKWEKEYIERNQKDDIED